MSEVRKKLIIDTDPGVDDAEAIVAALADPSADVIAITTVAGNAGLAQVTANLRKLLRVCNRSEIPIHVGADRSLLGSNLNSVFHGKDGFGDVDVQSEGDVHLTTPEDTDLTSSSEHAALALWKYASAYPNEITLIAIGPLTNVALAIRLHSEFGSKLKDCFIMGGNYQGRGNVTPSAEFNFYCDPEAASIVFNELGCPITLVPWELCLASAWDWDTYDELRSSPKKVVTFLKAIEYFSTTMCRERQYPGFVLCDQLAVFAALHPPVIRQAMPVHARIELGGSHTRGQVVIDWRKATTYDEPALITGRSPNIRLVTELHTDVVVQLVKRVINSPLID